jgi:hypothetical protein
LDALCAFCDFVMKCYQDESLLDQLKQRIISNKEPGISDMILLNEFRSLNPSQIAELSAIIDNSTYDQNINFAEHFEMENGIKKIIWIDGKPFGRHVKSGNLIKFNVLHFQGRSKVSIKDYFTGGLCYSQEKDKWSLKSPKQNNLFVES